MAIIIGREVGEGGTLEGTLESPGQVDSQRQLDSFLSVIFYSPFTVDIHSSLGCLGPIQLTCISIPKLCVFYFSQVDCIEARALSANFTAKLGIPSLARHVLQAWT